MMGGKQPKFPLTGAWIKRWYMYTMEYYPTIKDLEEQSPTFLAPGTNFMRDNF